MTPVLFMVEAAVGFEYREVITAGTPILVAIIAAVGLVQSAQINAGRRESKRGRVASELAAERSAPTGNGYAARTEAKLDRLLSDLGQVQGDVTGLRQDHRDLSRRVDRHSIRLDRHITPERNNT